MANAQPMREKSRWLCLNELTEKSAADISEICRRKPPRATLYLLLRANAVPKMAEKQIRSTRPILSPRRLLNFNSQLASVASNFRHVHRITSHRQRMELSWHLRA